MTKQAIKISTTSDRKNTTTIRAEVNAGYVSISKRQYLRARRTLGASIGDSLMLAPQDNKPDVVAIFDADGAGYGIIR